MKMHTSHKKINLTILIELLSVYIMNKKKSITEIKCQGHRKVLNEILNRNRGKGGFQSTFKADSQEISDPKEIANLFLKYKGPNLASKIPVSEKSRNPFLHPKLINSILLDAANELACVADTLNLLYRASNTNDLGNAWARGSASGDSWWECAAQLSSLTPYFRPKKCNFHTRFQTWPSLLRLERILKKFFKSISNSHVSFSFLLIWNWNDKYLHTLL